MTVPAPVVPRPATTAPTTDGYRPDVQGLRAIAVGLVVVYHLWPGALPGGYVGVDIFFVISGFLITGMLARTHERTGRIRLLDFYGRRARRLLPAAVLVLVVTWLVSRVVLPVTQLPAAAQQIRASALYFQNWILARDSVDYLHAGSTASPVQHFWSLSVEEQFYLGWPLLFLLAGALVALVGPVRRGTGRGPSARAVALALATGVVVASLWFSVHETAANPAAAYFVTPTRIWELGLGGVLALLPAGLTRRLGRSGPLAWIGLVMVLGSAVLITGTASFPGWLALVPVMGAVLLLAAGSPAARFGPSQLTATRPMVFLGGISYSLYLWHWPAIVLWKAWSGRAIGPVDGIVIIAGSVVLAWLTKRFVEDPIRTATFVVRNPIRSLSTAAATVVPVALVSVFLAGQTSSVPVAPNAQHPGAAALANSLTVPKTSYIPSAAQLPDDITSGFAAKCQAPESVSAVATCAMGDTSDPVLTIALVGDSHAAQWSDALDEIGKKRHWKIIVATKSRCVFTATEIAVPGAKSAYTSCATWGKSLLTKLTTTIKPDVVLTTERSYDAVPPQTTVTSAGLTTIGDGMATYWKELMAHGIDVVALHETPELPRGVPDCLASRTETVTSCGTSVADAFTAVSPVTVAARHFGSTVPVIDLTSLICTDTTCPAVVGNVAVYIDTHHLSRTYTLTLAPYLEKYLLRDDDLSRAS